MCFFSRIWLVCNLIGIEIQETSFHKAGDDSEQENYNADEIKLGVVPVERFEDSKLEKEIVEKVFVRKIIFF